MSTPEEEQHLHQHQQLNHPGNNNKHPRDEVEDDDLNNKRAKTEAPPFAAPAAPTTVDPTALAADIAAAAVVQQQQQQQHVEEHHHQHHHHNPATTVVAAPPPAAAPPATHTAWTEHAPVTAPAAEHHAPHQHHDGNSGAVVTAAQPSVVHHHAAEAVTVAAPPPPAVAAPVAVAVPEHTHHAETTTAATTVNSNVSADVNAAYAQLSAQALQQQPSLSDLITRQLWDNDSQVVLQALETLADLSYEGTCSGDNTPNAAAANRVAISVTGGLLAIVKAIERHTVKNGSIDDNKNDANKQTQLNATVVTAGGRALQNLALDANCKAGIARAGGLAAMIQAMQVYSGHEGVQLAGAGLCYNCIYGHEGNRMLLYKAGAVPRLLHALAQFPRNAQVAEWACGALYLLSVGERQIHTALLQDYNTAAGGSGSDVNQNDNNTNTTGGVLTALTRAIAEHPGNAGVYDKARNALARLLWQS